jgi:L-aminopeptidase/D-esterase-like protein
MKTTRLPDGFTLGHWTNEKAATGCSVILCPPGTVGSCDVRGSSPGSRELALLAPDKTMQQVNAVFLTGGSAFGLSVGDGVMRYLEEKGIGYQTPWIKVPIVPGAVIFDLNIGSAIVRPTAENGYQACLVASADVPLEGNVGAGTGATVGKWGGGSGRMKGGFGASSLVNGEIIVTALAVVNALGDVLNADGTIIAGARLPDGGWLADRDRFGGPDVQSPLYSNTTLVAILTNANLTKVEANRLAQRGHDGMARAIRPAHTSYDGDVVFAFASGGVRAPFDLVAEMGAEAVAEAIRNGVRSAVSVEGVPACQ